MSDMHSSMSASLTSLAGREELFAADRTTVRDITFVRVPVPDALALGGAGTMTEDA